MFKQDLTFKDYNGADRKITLYFHLNKKEIVDLQASTPNGIQADMQQMILSNDVKQLLDFVTNLVHLSYGIRSADGMYFNKSDDILRNFAQSVYYDDFMMELLEDNGAKAQTFITGIMPADLVAQAEAQVRGGQQTQAPVEVDQTQYAPSVRETFAASQAQASQQPTGNDFGQPSYPQVSEPQTPVQPVSTGPTDAEKYQRYLAWQAQQDAAAAPVSPDAFRVPAEDPSQGLPRPPHESLG